VKKRTDAAVNYAILVLFTAYAVVPLGGIVLIALRPPGTFGGQIILDQGLHFENFVTAWNQANLGPALLSSAIITITAVLGASFIAILSGYALGTMSFHGKNILLALYLIGLMVPLEALVIPLFYEFRGLSLTDTYFGVILPELGIGAAFGSFWMRGFFSGVPQELLDAAQIDGAGTWMTLWRILVPIARPSILSMALLMFVGVWNDFLLALVLLLSQTVTTAPLTLSSFQGRYSTDFTLTAAAAVMIAAPTIIVVLLTQKQFIHGVTSGSVKW
jgi:raffinose/stachyose/melibiose transport system permease protein